VTFTDLVRMHLGGLAGPLSVAQKVDEACEEQLRDGTVTTT
jgi:hypothetical protein